jgi:hypothetical protein
VRGKSGVLPGGLDVTVDQNAGCMEQWIGRVGCVQGRSNECEDLEAADSHFSDLRAVTPDRSLVMCRGLWAGSGSDRVQGVGVPSPRADSKSGAHLESPSQMGTFDWSGAE